MDSPAISLKFPKLGRARVRCASSRIRILRSELSRIRIRFHWDGNRRKAVLADELRLGALPQMDIFLCSPEEHRRMPGLPTSPCRYSRSFSLSFVWKRVIQDRRLETSETEMREFCVLLHRWKDCFLIPLKLLLSFASAAGAKRAAATRSFPSENISQERPR